MRNRVIVWMIATIGLLCLAAAPGPAKRVIIISWDGAPDWVIDKLLQEGKLPNLARMVRTGVHAESVTPAFPSKTAPGHAAIWTGAYSDVNGGAWNTASGQGAHIGGGQNNSSSGGHGTVIGGDSNSDRE